MLKKIVLAASLLVSAAAPAYAGVLVTTLGSPASFAAPVVPSSYTVNFNSPVVAPFALATTAGSGIVTGSVGSQYAQPAFSDGSSYLAVLGGGSGTLAATVASGLAFDSVSFYLGSIDFYNTINILSTTGATIASYTGTQLTAPLPADGSQPLPQTNRRITFSRSAGDAQIGGVQFLSSQNAAEVDNVVFAVPEPSTWMFMLAGFGVVGFAMRSRRRRIGVVYA
jgi:hypothetical protein